MNIFKNILILVLGISTVSITSCASGYNMINPQAINYAPSYNESSVLISYKYNMLEERGNKKYAKKETKKDLSVVALKITNNSPKSILFSEDVNIYSSGSIVYPVESEIVFNQIKQITPLYLLYSLLFLNISDCENLDCEVTSIPIGIPIAIGNMAVAGTANKRMKNELATFDILRKEIKPGETAYGLITVKDTGYNPLTFKAN